MKSKDLQNVVLSKYQKDYIPTETHRDSNGRITLATIKKWCQMICQSDSIHLRGTRAAPRIVRALRRI